MSKYQAHKTKIKRLEASLSIMQDVYDMLNRCDYGGSNTVTSRSHERRLKRTLYDLHQIIEAEKIAAIG